MNEKQRLAVILLVIAIILLVTSVVIEISIAGAQKAREEDSKGRVFEATGVVQLEILSSKEGGVNGEG